MTVFACFYYEPPSAFLSEESHTRSLVRKYVSKCDSFLLGVHNTGPMNIPFQDPDSIHYDTGIYGPYWPTYPLWADAYPGTIIQLYMYCSG